MILHSSLKSLSGIFNAIDIIIILGGNDCVREKNLGCNQTLGESNIAKTVMLDLILLSSNDIFLGKFGIRTIDFIIDLIIDLNRYHEIIIFHSDNVSDGKVQREIIASS
jgi:hypothetical protein